MMCFRMRMQPKSVVKCGKKALAAIHAGLCPIDVREHTLVRSYAVILPSLCQTMHIPADIRFAIMMPVLEALRTLTTVSPWTLHPLALSDLLREITTLCDVASRMSQACVQCYLNLVAPEDDAAPCTICLGPAQTCLVGMLAPDMEDLLLLKDPRPELAAFDGRRAFHQRHADRLARCSGAAADRYRQQHLQSAMCSDAVGKVVQALAQYRADPMKNRHESAMRTWLAVASGTAHPAAEVAQVQAALDKGALATTTEEMVTK